MKIPIRTELLVIPGDTFCKKCNMRLYPNKEHTEEMCIVAQVMEYDDKLGWSMTEKIGIAVANSRGITKPKP
jgi:hypothetical protein